jgi:hypothetical protein
MKCKCHLPSHNGTEHKAMLPLSGTQTKCNGTGSLIQNKLATPHERNQTTTQEHYPLEFKISFASNKSPAIMQLIAMEQNNKRSICKHETWLLDRKRREEVLLVGLKKLRTLFLVS